MLSFLFWVAVVFVAICAYQVLDAFVRERQRVDRLHRLHDMEMRQWARERLERETLRSQGT